MANNKQIKEYPASTSQLWTYTSARQAIDGQVQGDFAGTTQLGRSMMTDGRFRAVLDKRVLGLVKSETKVTPVDPKDPMQLEATKLVQDNLYHMLPETQLIRWLTYYHVISLAPGTLDWSYASDAWVPQLRTLNPEHTRFSQLTEDYTHQTRDGQQDLTPGDGRWLLLSTWEQGLPSGLVSSLGMLWVTKMYALQDLLEWNSVHASPILKAITPQDAAPEARTKFVNDVAAARNTKVVECQQAADGSGWDVQLVNAPTQGADQIMGLIEYVDTQATIAALGANLTTEVSSVGARSAAETHLGVQRELVKADAQLLSTVVREQVIRPFVKANLGDVEPPWVEWLIVGDDVTESDTQQESDEQQATNDQVANPLQ